MSRAANRAIGAARDAHGAVFAVKPVKDQHPAAQRLARAGFDPGGADGKIGPDTIAAIRGYQVASGMTPDGYPSYDLLNRLR